MSNPVDALKSKVVQIQAIFYPGDYNTGPHTQLFALCQEIADIELNEIHRGEFVGVVQVDGVQYSISEAAKEQFEPGEHWAKRS